MALTTSSRYTTQTDTATGSVIAVRKVMGSISYTTYVTASNETFEMIAVRIFRDATQYWQIADLNPHVKFPDHIPVGTTIRIPS
jgi:nucleoid-associated protein YgaU